MIIFQSLARKSSCNQTLVTCTIVNGQLTMQLVSKLRRSHVDCATESRRKTLLTVELSSA